MTASELARQLHGKKAGKRWMCRCPTSLHAHGDRNRSLSMWESPDGWVGLNDVKMEVSGVSAPAKPYRLGGRIMTTPSSELYRELPLTKGQVVIVDASDYEWLNQWKWSAMWNAHTRSFVACRGINNKGKSKKFLMHREIMVLTFGDGRMVDHINHDTLDNRRENLRIVNNSQNQRNRRNRSDNKSGFKGVSYCRGRNKWQAHIYMNGKSVSLGRFTTPEAAYEAYCFAAQEHYGEYACMP